MDKQYKEAVIKDLKDIFMKGFSIFQTNLIKLAIIQLIIITPQILITILNHSISIQKYQTISAILSVLNILLVISNLILYIIMTISMILLITNSYLGKQMDIRSAIKYSFAKIGIFIKGQITMMFIIALSGIPLFLLILNMQSTVVHILLFIVFSIPFIYASTTYGLIPIIACVHENPEFINLSKKIVKGNFILALLVLSITKFSLFFIDIFIKIHYGMQNNLVVSLVTMGESLLAPIILCIEVSLFYDLIRLQFDNSVPIKNKSQNKGCKID